MLIVDMPKEYLTDACGFVLCNLCKQYLPLVYRDCHKDDKGCLIKGELVRCSECKFYTQMDDGTYGLCEFFGGSMVNSWYCSNGERKDGERDGET